ncbi:NADPH-dependent FMN reductase [Natronoglycomyces albus]|uniref:NAD(P)H-dependent oxidoreductase n=1 Tax=Natronoglycomyces albus TaxID=2811108 RepID=A0A895XSP7_9ACTN|nr:NAD(P)H-dependent oxidoreductase [Natronoglycomyces albus]QSB04658.1 NAD(P)H-dependent oxidoreductase [Natronoglycomyces albus]
MKLHVIIASTRPGRVGDQVGEWFAAQAQAHGSFHVRLVDLAEVNLPFLDEPAHPSARKYTHEHTRAWSATIDQADAFVFVTPEYNNGMNAPLKNALDFLYHEWAYKPAGFVSYGGASAGLRAVQMAKQVATTLRMYVVSSGVAISKRQRFEEGRLRPDSGMERAASGMLDELAKVAPAMRSLREAT